MTSREKARSAASSGAWNTLPERPKPATAVRMGAGGVVPGETEVMTPRYAEGRYRGT